MPKIIRCIGEILPNTPFIRMTYGIMLRDASLGDIASELLILVIFTFVPCDLLIVKPDWFQPRSR